MPPDRSRRRRKERDSCARSRCSPGGAENDGRGLRRCGRGPAGSAAGAASPRWRKARRSLQHLELEFHHFAAHHVAKIVLPKAAVARKSIDQKLKAEPPPHGQQFHAHRDFPEARARVVSETAVVLAEIAEAEAVEVAFVRG